MALNLLCCCLREEHVMDQQQQHTLQVLIGQQLKLDSTAGIDCHIMSGGAIQENWSITPKDKTQHWGLVLRKNASTTLDTSSDREQEFILLQQLHAYGVPVPQPLYFSKKENFLDSDFFIMQKVYGVTEGHKLVRLHDVAQQSKILQNIGMQLAKIHQIEQDDLIEQYLPKPKKDSYFAEMLAELIAQIDVLNRHQPVLEYAITWMKKNSPTVDDLVLIHGDFRTGNLMIDGDQITGILDWEFTHWGDRREDIGWFSAKCWRFGQDQHLAGGIGAYKDFMQAYAAISDLYIPEFELKFWHILAHVRWAIIAMQQAHRNIGASHPSLELALTDYLVPLLEKNILDLLEDKE